LKQLNFEKKLIAWYEANKGREMQWGIFDCAIATLGGLSVVYGENIVSPYTWNSKKEAYKIYKKLYSTAQAFIDAGFEITKRIHTGDAIVLKTPKMHTSCIVINDRITIFDEKEGFQLRKISEIACEYIILRRNI
jgi:hypothetical protein